METKEMRQSNQEEAEQLDVLFTRKQDLEVTMRQLENEIEEVRGISDSSLFFPPLHTPSHLWIFHLVHSTDFSLHIIFMFFGLLFFTLNWSLFDPKERHAGESLVEAMQPNLRQKYLQVRAANTSLLQHLDIMQHELDSLDARKAALEDELTTSKVSGEL